MANQYTAPGHHRGEDPSMPIAIVGMSCRFPGDATDPRKLWQMCAAARDAWSPVPKERFNQDAFYHPVDNRNGTSNVRGAHFLTEDLSLFDAPFFNMTPAEAAVGSYLLGQMNMADDILGLRSTAKITTRMLLRSSREW
jgi:hypothetical protein